MPRTANANTSPWSYVPVVGGIDGTTTAVTIKGAAGAGVRNYITDIHVSHATLAAATVLAVRDGAGGAVLWRMQLGTTAVESLPIIFTTPLRGTANTLLEIVTLTSSAGDVFVNVQGFSAV